MSNTTPPRVEGQDWCDEETMHVVVIGGRHYIAFFERDGEGYDTRRTIDVDGLEEHAARMVACTRTLAGTPLPDDVEPGAITQRLYDSAQALTDAEVKLREKDEEIARLTAQVEAMRPVVKAVRACLAAEAALDSADEAWGRAGAGYGASELWDRREQARLVYLDAAEALRTALVTNHGGQSDG
jgi:hypothetical protein